MNASDLIAEFAQRAHVSGLSFNEAGRARVQVDDALVVDLEDDPASGQLHVYCSIAETPASGREAFFEQLLVLNLFCRSTLGATLALDPATREILLCRVLPLEATDYQSFETAMTQIVDAAAAVRAALAEAAHQAAPAEIAGAELPDWTIRA